MLDIAKDILNNTEAFLSLLGAFLMILTFAVMLTLRPSFLETQELVVMNILVFTTVGLNICMIFLARNGNMSLQLTTVAIAFSITAFIYSIVLRIRFNERMR
jgi:hypothetical protein